MATYRYTNISSLASLKLTDRPVYGSQRLGSYGQEYELLAAPAYTSGTAAPVQQIELNYELSDHLGNVTTVLTGRLLNGNGVGSLKQPELVSAQGYEPFGSLLPGRNFSSGSYRYLFQGQEHDDEINGAPGTSYAFEYRMHDPRVGRFLSIDPLAAKYAYNSPYAFSENRVLDGVELEGLEWQRIVGQAAHDMNFDMSRNSDVRYIYGKAGINPNIVASDETRLKIDRCVKPVVAIVAGTVTIVVTAGAGAPPVLAAFAISTGSMSIAGGTMQLALIGSGADQSKVDQVPTSYLGATVGMMVRATVGDEERSAMAVGVIEAVDGALTLNISSLPKSFAEGADLVFDAVQITGGIGGAYDAYRKEAEQAAASGSAGSATSGSFSGDIPMPDTTQQPDKTSVSPRH